ncbi:MAG: hypothetical protein GXO82_09500 [Chlorobi bacterium]|nr:hypothetical protein [Chlorobiota bacterium]
MTIPLKTSANSLFVVFVCLALFSGCSRHSVERYIAPKLAGMQLGQVIKGDQAQKIISNLHADMSTDAESAIATYSNRQYKSVAYLTLFESAEKSDTLARSMVEKIAKGGTPFPEPMMRADVAGVWQMEGEKEMNYIVVRSKLLAWLTVDRPVGEAFLQDFLRWIPAERP